MRSNEAYGLTVDQSQRRPETECRNPRGSFLSGPSEIALRTMGRIQNVEDFNKIIIAYSGIGHHIREISAGCWPR